jgi:hypothetical protein
MSTEKIDVLEQQLARVSKKLKRYKACLSRLLEDDSDASSEKEEESSSSSSKEEETPEAKKQRIDAVNKEELEALATLARTGPPPVIVAPIEPPPTAAHELVRNA